MEAEQANSVRIVTKRQKYKKNQLELNKVTEMKTTSEGINSKLDSAKEC